MRSPRPLFPLLAFLVVPASLFAQAGSTPPVSSLASDPQAVALVRQSLAALTGGAAITDVTLTGTAHRIAGSDDVAGAATLEATAAGDSRIDLTFPSGDWTEIRNHAGTPLPGTLPPGLPAAATQGPRPVGARSGPDGVVHEMMGQDLMTDSSWFFPALTLSRLLSSPLYVLSYIGSETHWGQTVVHLSAVQQFSQVANAPAQDIALLQHLSRMDFYLDPTSLLPVALRFNTHPDGNAMIDIATEVRFSDYRVVSGVQIPFHVQECVNGSLAFDLGFSNVTLNSGLSGTNFEIQ
jgi:hypothetical protein